VVSSPVEFVTSEDSNFQEKITLLDVHVLDSSCLNEESCQSWQPENLIEYFGADWCEPCLEIEQEINQLDFNQSVVIQHHPSTIDLTHLEYSKLKFDNQYRLLFIPSIVINGQGLLTGSSQGLEINKAVDEINSSFDGINNIELNNGTLYWNASSVITSTCGCLRKHHMSMKIIHIKILPPHFFPSNLVTSLQYLDLDQKLEW